jgi:hypothetical protein
MHAMYPLTIYLDPRVKWVGETRGGRKSYFWIRGIWGKMSMELVGAGCGGEHASADGVRNKVCFVDTCVLD